MMGRPEEEQRNIGFAV